MDNAEVARVLEEIGRLMRLQGGNPFKIRAYLEAAETIRGLDVRLDELAEEGRLREVPGIGPAIAAKIETYRATGAIPTHQRLVAEIPPGVLEVVAVPGIGPKRARALHEALGVASLADLASVAESGRLGEVPGFGPRSVASVRAALDRLRAWSGRWLASDARVAARTLLDSLSGHPATRRAELAGALRRGLETVEGIELLAVADEPDAILGAFVGHPAVAEVAERGASAASVRLGGGLPAAVVVVPAAAWGSEWIRLTGSAAHVARLEEIARTKGTGLDGPDEAAVYDALGLSWVPPELREDRGEIEAALRNALPTLVTTDDLAGLVHVHTTWSDGRDSIGAMAEAARRAGFAYMVVTDHSRSAGYAGGLIARDLASQREEIDRVDASLDGFTVLAGSEVDLLPDGSLDYPDDVLAALDVVVASVHGAFGLSRAAQTARLVAAIENPHVDVLGHPTGRVLLRREGIDVDMERVLDAAAEHGVALEVNGDPRRLELDWRWHRAATERGVRLSLDPDAHGTETIAPLVEGAVGAARKGGVEPGHVLNALPPEEFVSALRSNR